MEKERSKRTKESTQKKSKTSSIVSEIIERKYMDKQAEELVETEKKHNTREMYRIVKNITSEARLKKA